MVKFISYTGEYPALCHGDLTLNINNKQYTFKENEKFWYPAGAAYATDRTIKGEWRVDKSNLPDALKVYANEIAKVINEHIPHGCCGGCNHD